MGNYTKSIKESTLLIGQDQSLVGIMTERIHSVSGKKNPDTGVLLLNAGLIHHIGPNRIYVKLARRLAQAGCVVLRFDYSGIGDSGPRKDKLPVSESVVEESRQAMNYLETTRGVRCFVLIGLCAGAANAFRMATIDQRVKSIILINPLLPSTQQVERMRQASHYRHRALLNPYSWVKFFSMKVNYRSMLQVIGYEFKKKFFPKALRKREPEVITNAISRGFQLIRKNNVKTLMINSTDDVGWKYFKEILGPEYNALKKAGVLKTEVLSGSDHTVTPLSCQGMLLDLISEWISANY